MSTPAVGDRVKVSYEGTYERKTNGDHFVRGPDNRQHFYKRDQGVTIEVIEPEYTPGHFYRDAHGELYLRVPDLTGHPWRFIDRQGGFMQPRTEGFPHKPLADLGTLGETAL